MSIYNSFKCDICKDYINDGFTLVAKPERKNNKFKADQKYEIISIVQGLHEYKGRLDDDTLLRHYCKKCVGLISQEYIKMEIEKT